MMHTKEFLVFKDRLVEYLRNFIKGLQRNVGVIEEDLRTLEDGNKQQVFEKIVQYEMLIPRMDVEVSRELLEEKTKGRFQSIYEWFVSSVPMERIYGLQLVSRKDNPQVRIK
jgi:hypothetical protein